MKLLRSRIGARERKAREATPLFRNLTIDPSWFVERKAITLGKQLGSGAFGTVHICTVEDWSANEVVAKRVLPQKMKAADADLLRNEITIWSLLVHPNTVKVGSPHASTYSVTTPLLHRSRVLTPPSHTRHPLA